MTSSRILMAIALCLVALGLTLPSQMKAVATTDSYAMTDMTIYMPMMCVDDCSGRYANRLRAIELINIERAKVGCPAALIHDNLMRATQVWSEYMDSNGDFRHAPGSHYAQYGYPQGTLENIGISGSPEQFVEAMLESPLHRENMLTCPYHDPENPDLNPNAYYEIGVGESNDYWTMAIKSISP